MDKNQDTTKVTIPDFPVNLITRLRVRAAQKGERGYGKELVRVLEGALNTDNKGEIKMDDPLINYAQIAIGSARIEERAPSTDNEYLSLFWIGNKEWILESNAGVVASCYQDYIESVANAVTGLEEEGQLILAEEIQGEINKRIKKSGAKVSPCKMGYEARDIAMKWGWVSREWIEDNC